MSDQGDTSQTTASQPSGPQIVRRSPRWMKILLVLSLALNLAAAGFLVSHESGQCLRGLAVAECLQRGIIILNHPGLKLCPQPAQLILVIRMIDQIVQGIHRPSGR